MLLQPYERADPQMGAHYMGVGSHRKSFITSGQGDSPLSDCCLKYGSYVSVTAPLDCKIFDPEYNTVSDPLRELRSVENKSRADKVTAHGANGKILDVFFFFAH